MISHSLSCVTAGIIKHHPLVSHTGIELEKVVQAAPESGFDHFGWHIVASQSHAMFDTTNGQAAAAHGKVINSDMAALRFELQLKGAKAPAGECGFKSKVGACHAQFPQAVQHDATSGKCNGLRMLASQPTRNVIRVDKGGNAQLGQYRVGMGRFTGPVGARKNHDARVGEWGCHSLPPAILQPRHSVKHWLTPRHMIRTVRHKVPKPLKLELLVRLRSGQ